MAVQNNSVLQRSALLSGLITREQLDEAMAKAKQPEFGVPAPRVEVTDDQLARQLIELELLTPYQAEQLKAGRTKLTLGPYTITDWIAQGGMGQVFKAEHQMMGREVAIKVLPHNRSTPQAIDNFMREIRAQAVLDHDNLVRAYDAGHDGNVYYLVTEFVKGTDLRRFVRSQGPLSIPQAASIMLQAAHGLASAHEQGLIHRDIKPGNILVTPDGKAKVSDLGLAGFLQSNEYDPRSHKIVGTADYISPEQIKSPESVTPTSDIYSLGCTLYYTVTGKVPFPGGTTRDKARRHCEETPWHPRRFNPDVNEDFVDIIADMMEKDPAKRVPAPAKWSRGWNPGLLKRCGSQRNNLRARPGWRHPYPRMPMMMMSWRPRSTAATTKAIRCRRPVSVRAPSPPIRRRRKTLDPDVTAWRLHYPSRHRRRSPPAATYKPCC